MNPIAPDRRSSLQKRTVDLDRDVSQPTELAGGLARGDEQALAHLYDRYGTAVYRLALRITRDPATAEEISLDVFLQVWRQAARYDAAHGTLASWLFTIARSRAIDAVRAAGAAKRTLTKEAAWMPDAPRPDEMTETAERRRLVHAALADLTPPQRTALELAFYEGLSHSQIAARLGEPLGTIKTRIRQAMLVLRRALTPVLSATL